MFYNNSYKFIRRCDKIGTDQFASWTWDYEIFTQSLQKRSFPSAQNSFKLEEFAKYKK